MNLIRRIIFILTLKCDGTARLLSASQERPLTVSERLAMRGHMALCAGCRRYARYLRALRQALRSGLVPDAESDGDGALSSDAKQRMRDAIRRGGTA